MIAMFLLGSGFSGNFPQWFTLPPCSGLVQSGWGQEGYIKPLRHWLWESICCEQLAVRLCYFRYFFSLFVLLMLLGLLFFCSVSLWFLGNKTTTFFLHRLLPPEPFFNYFFLCTPPVPGSHTEIPHLCRITACNATNVNWLFFKYA